MSEAASVAAACSRNELLLKTREAEDDDDDGEEEEEDEEEGEEEDGAGGKAGELGAPANKDVSNGENEDDATSDADEEGGDVKDERLLRRFGSRMELEPLLGLPGCAWKDEDEASVPPDAWIFLRNASEISATPGNGKDGKVNDIEMAEVRESNRKV